jgi:hypothetical protein
MFQDVFLRPSHLILPVDTKVEKHETEMEMMEELSSAFQDFHLTEEEDDVEDVDSVDYRVLFQGRDLELEPLWRSRGRVGSSRLESGRPNIRIQDDPSCLKFIKMLKDIWNWYEFQELIIWIYLEHFGVNSACCMPQAVLQEDFIY